MKRSMREKAIAGCLAAALLLLGACGSRSGEDEQEVGSESIGVEETDGTDVEMEGEPIGEEEDFVLRRPDPAWMEGIDVKAEADFDTISLETLQGYRYCNEGGGYEVFVRVEGDRARICETFEGEPMDVWNGEGTAVISQAGKNGWNNPGLNIDDADGFNIAMLVLRRVEGDYFTTANSGVYYKVDMEE